MSRSNKLHGNEKEKMRRQREKQLAARRNLVDRWPVAKSRVLELLDMDEVVEAQDLLEQFTKRHPAHTEAAHMLICLYE